MSKISNNAIKILEERYLLKNSEGELIETVDGLFERVAGTIASADELHGATEKEIAQTRSEFKEMMQNLEFMPNSPTLMNAGTEIGQLSACFVLPVEDSMEAIFESVKNGALVHKSGGGTGYSFSRIRSDGANVGSTSGVASGPISFMTVFNAATETVKQGSRRRGANMGILRIDHPQIKEFITCKNDTSQLNNFNISVGITEDFMLKVKNGENYDLIDPSTKRVIDSPDAGEVFDLIVDSAWKTGEPGIIFLDRLNKDNIVPGVGELEATNPCGEQPLLPYESCNLGSINLVQMTSEKEDGTVTLDMDKLTRTVRKAVHFLDNVIDVNRYPLDEITRMTKSTRKIGLGIMGYADLLLEMNMRYGSEEAIKIAEDIVGIIQTVGRDESIKLAKKRGAFPLFDESTYAGKSEPLRNGTITTIAPTGTISVICGASSGIEPVFGFAFIRNIMDGTEMLEINPILKKRLEAEGIYSEELMRKIIQEGSLQHIEEIPQHIKEVFVCAHDITPGEHILTQSAFQKYTDNAVSKTVNFTKDATREEVAEVYMMAFETGCKGVTIYRDGSRDEQVLNIGAVNKKKDDSTEGIKESKPLAPRERPDEVQGMTEKMKTGCGNLYVTVSYDDQGLCEVFTNTGKAGGCPCQSEATSRLISIALRCGLPVETITEQLRGIRCPSTIKRTDANCLSCPDAIARVIRKQQERGARLINAGLPVIDPVEVPEEEPENICPTCGSKAFFFAEGCRICIDCGYSKCG